MNRVTEMELIKQLSRIADSLEYLQEIDELLKLQACKIEEIKDQLAWNGR